MTILCNFLIEKSTNIQISHIKHPCNIYFVVSTNIKTCLLNTVAWLWGIYPQGELVSVSNWFVVETDLSPIKVPVSE